MSQHPPRTILRDDDGRPVAVWAYVKDSQGHKVLLERKDRRPRERRIITRWEAEVAHYPIVEAAP